MIVLARLKKVLIVFYMLLKKEFLGEHMSTDYTAIVGFGIDLGKSRPEAVFSPRGRVPGFDPSSKGPFDHPVELASYAYAAYSDEHARYFFDRARHRSVG
jgi:hypothetical protein